MSPGLQEAALQEDAQQQPQHRGGRGWADGGKERMNGCIPNMAIPFGKLT